jgi:hypothetical protein
MLPIQKMVNYFNSHYTPELHIGHLIGRWVAGGIEIVTNLQGEGSYANKYIKGPIEQFFQRKLKKADFGQIGFGVLTKN